jgi:hypothetical protein
MWTSYRGRHYLARRQREQVLDERHREELDQTREGILKPPNPGPGL